jgi:MacB-like periplasmic core domain
VLEQIAAAPGVASAGVVSDLPLAGNQLTFAVLTDGDAADRPRESRVTVRPADPGYFRTLRIPLDSGRYFEPGDRSGGAPVAIVNRAAAEMLWRGAAMNRRVRVTDDVPREVVGIVGDIKHAGLHANEGPVIYVPYAQKSLDFVNWMGIVVRGTDVSASVVKAAIARVDPNQPVHAVMAMDEYVARERAPYRFGALVVFSLAGAGFILAVTGVYGLTTFIVGRRFRELGVRLALGAPPSAVVVLVLQQILSMLVLGAVAGTAGSLLTTRLLQATMPPSSAATDPLVIAGALDPRRHVGGRRIGAGAARRSHRSESRTAFRMTQRPQRPQRPQRRGSVHFSVLSFVLCALCALCVLCVYRRRIVTPPFVVTARIFGPPAPSVVVMRRSFRPVIVIGKSMLMRPLTVSVSSSPEYVAGSVTRTPPFLVSTSSPAPSQ